MLYRQQQYSHSGHAITPLTLGELYVLMIRTNERHNSNRDQGGEVAAQDEQHPKFLGKMKFWKELCTSSDDTRQPFKIFHVAYPAACSASVLYISTQRWHDAPSRRLAPFILK